MARELQPRYAREKLDQREYILNVPSKSKADRRSLVVCIDDVESTIERGKNPKSGLM